MIILGAANRPPFTLPPENRREWFHIRDITGIANPELIPILQEIYERSRWVYDHYRDQENCRMLRGRHPVIAGTLHGKSIIFKRLVHGGRLAGITRDLFLSRSRIITSITASDFLIRQGVRTPGIAFTAWRRNMVFWQGEIGTDHILDGIDASDYFFNPSGAIPGQWKERAMHIGKMVATLHRIQFCHPDLNLMNFYFDLNGNVMILDLDKAAIPGSILSKAQKTRNLERLHRSVMKQARRCRKRLSQNSITGHHADASPNQTDISVMTSWMPEYAMAISRLIAQGYRSDDI